MKSELTLASLHKEAYEFAKNFKNCTIPELYGVSDGKKIGTYIEKKFKNMLAERYLVILGNSSNGIDLPGLDTDIKATSAKQPQSSAPFRSVEQLVYGLGYNILLFVYKKIDDHTSKTSNIKFAKIGWIGKNKTADCKITRKILDILAKRGSEKHIFDYLTTVCDLNDTEANKLTQRIMQEPPKQGELTLSDALQWRVQYSNVGKF